MALKNATGEKEGAQNFWVNPPDNIAVKAGVVVIVMGDVSDIHRAKNESAKPHAFTAHVRVWPQLSVPKTLSSTAT